MFKCRISSQGDVKLYTSLGAIIAATTVSNQVAAFNWLLMQMNEFDISPDKIIVMSA